MTYDSTFDDSHARYLALELQWSIVAANYHRDHAAYRRSVSRPVIRTTRITRN
jgi:hypothetical protein